MSLLALLCHSCFLCVDISEQSGRATDREKIFVGLGTANLLKELIIFYSISIMDPFSLQTVISERNLNFCISVSMKCL